MNEAALQKEDKMEVAKGWDSRTYLPTPQPSKPTNPKESRRPLFRKISKKISLPE